MTTVRRPQAGGMDLSMAETDEKTVSPTRTSKRNKRGFGGSSRANPSPVEEGHHVLAEDIPVRSADGGAAFPGKDNHAEGDQESANDGELSIASYSSASLGSDSNIDVPLAHDRVKDEAASMNVWKSDADWELLPTARNCKRKKQKCPWSDPTPVADTPIPLPHVLAEDIPARSADGGVAFSGKDGHAERWQEGANHSQLTFASCSPEFQHDRVKDEAGGMDFSMPQADWEPLPPGRTSNSKNKRLDSNESSWSSRAGGMDEEPLPPGGKTKGKKNISKSMNLADPLPVAVHDGVSVNDDTAAGESPVGFDLLKSEMDEFPVSSRTNANRKRNSAFQAEICLSNMAAFTTQRRCLRTNSSRDSLEMRRAVAVSAAERYVSGVVTQTWCDLLAKQQLPSLTHQTPRNRVSDFCATTWQHGVSDDSGDGERTSKASYDGELINAGSTSGESESAAGRRRRRANSLTSGLAPTRVSKSSRSSSLSLADPNSLAMSISLKATLARDETMWHESQGSEPSTPESARPIATFRRQKEVGSRLKTKVQNSADILTNPEALAKSPEAPQSAKGDLRRTAFFRDQFMNKSAQFGPDVDETEHLSLLELARSLQLRAREIVRGRSAYMIASGFARPFDGKLKEHRVEKASEYLGLAEDHRNFAIKSMLRLKDENGCIDFNVFMEGYRDALHRQEDAVVRKKLEYAALAKQHSVDIDNVGLVCSCLESVFADIQEVTKDAFKQFLCKAFKICEPSELPEARLQRFWNEIDTCSTGAVPREELAKWWLKYFGEILPGDDGPLQHVYRSCRSTGNSRFRPDPSVYGMVPKKGSVLSVLEETDVHDSTTLRFVEEKDDHDSKTLRTVVKTLAQGDYVIAAGPPLSLSTIDLQPIRIDFANPDKYGFVNSAVLKLEVTIKASDIEEDCKPRRRTSANGRMQPSERMKRARPQGLSVSSVPTDSAPNSRRGSADSGPSADAANSGIEATLSAEQMTQDNEVQIQGRSPRGNRPSQTLVVPVKPLTRAPSKSDVLSPASLRIRANRFKTAHHLAEPVK